MCGIAGIVRPEPRGVEPRTLLRMAAAIRHRGPDGYGYYSTLRVGFAHVRLSIVDIAAGAQPMRSADGRLVITYNGEVYNHVELREELVRLGHRFRTRCDTEVLLHAYERWGEGMLNRLNGQFALAIHDRRDGSVFLARDRFGVRPLFYSLDRGKLVFASEVKAIFASGEVAAAPDPEGIDEVFTFWAARPPRTPFREIRSMEPGTWAVWSEGQLHTHRYFSPGYGPADDAVADPVDAFDALLRAGVEIRLRADVPVGAYLSGGLDSSITSTLAAEASPHDLRTFSVSFADPTFDEGEFQRMVARRIRSRHFVQGIEAGTVASVFAQVVSHCETPLVRTAPAPMFLLSRLARQNGITVVLTGEGADEHFLGYDLFKETLVRRFCLRRPDSAARPLLLDRLYPHSGDGARGGEFWRRFFLDAGDPGDPLFSHLPRFRLTSRIKEFYSPDLREQLAGFDPLAELRASLPAEFEGWDDLGRAAYLELTTLLSPYLLSSQGDRVAMAHGVEARYPFLDHELARFAAGLPNRWKLAGMREKAILRRWARTVVPRPVLERVKQPYRAPDAAAFFDATAPEYVRALLSSEEIAHTGYFDPRAVDGLVRRATAGRPIGPRENQALVAILSTQLWSREFLAAPSPVLPLAAEEADVAIVEDAPDTGAAFAFATLSPFTEVGT